MFAGWQISRRMHVFLKTRNQNNNCKYQTCYLIILDLPAIGILQKYMYKIGFWFLMLNIINTLDNLCDSGWLISFLLLLLSLLLLLLLLLLL